MKQYLLLVTLMIFVSACGTSVESTNTSDNVSQTHQPAIEDESDYNEDNTIISTEENSSNTTELISDSVIQSINLLRTKSGLNAVISSSELNISALNHAKYLIENDISGHNELNTAAQFYTGVAPVDRAMYAGYDSNFIIENVSTGQIDVQSSLDGLMSAIYHRFGFLDFNINLIGYGIEEDAYVYNMGNSYLNSLCNDNNFTDYGTYYYGVCSDESFRIEKSLYENANTTINNANPSYVFYPYKNQTDVTPVFYGESPDPLPYHDVSGYPISIEFNANDYNMSLFEITQFTLTNNDGDLIELINHTADSSTIMSINNDPNSKFSRYQFAIFPDQRLDYGTNYNVIFAYDYNNSSKIIEWNFKTKSLDNFIQYNNEDITISSNSTYNIYFEPLSANDTINNIASKCTATMKIDYSFYDANTISFTLSGEAGDYCDINLNQGDKTFRLEIAY